MDDLIKRQDAIEYFMTNTNWHDEEGYSIDDAEDKRALLTDYFNGVPSAQQWIPCSERLPEEEGQYLVTLDFEWGKEIEMGDWFNGEWVNPNSHVTVAWMPLPKPYKESED